jgi:hypothetical protein
VTDVAALTELGLLERVVSTSIAIRLTGRCRDHSPSYITCHLRVQSAPEDAGSSLARGSPPPVARHFRFPDLRNNSLTEPNNSL